MVSFGVALLDILIIAAATIVAAYLRFETTVSENSFALFVAIVPSYTLINLWLKSFDARTLSNIWRSLRRSVTAFLIAVVIAVISAFAFKVSESFSRLESGLFFVLGIVGLIGGRIFVWAAIKRMPKEVTEPLTMIMLDKNSVELSDKRLEGYGVFDISDPDFFPDYSTPDRLESFSKQCDAYERVVIVSNNTQKISEWSNFCRIMGINAEVLAPSLFTIPAIGLSNFLGEQTITVSRGPLEIAQRTVKRLFDLALTVPTIIILSPLMAIVAIMIKLDAPGPVIFVQDRIGFKNQRFKVYKFRTMKVGAEQMSTGQSTQKDDDRITPLGRILRKTSIDELPQLFNVLKGEMSLVGPRPHAPGSQASGQLFWEVAGNYWSRHAIKPGMTGLAQVRGYRGGDISDEDLRHRVVSDLEYLEHWSLLLDIKILILTVKVLLHENAF